MLYSRLRKEQREKEAKLRVEMELRRKEESQYHQLLKVEEQIAKERKVGHFHENFSPSLFVSIRGNKNIVY